jgi:hypothetical protein
MNIKINDAVFDFFPNLESPRLIFKEFESSDANSIRLLEKNGFVQEAHFKEDYFFDGRYIDSLIFSLLKPK